MASWNRRRDVAGEQSRTTNAQFFNSFCTRGRAHDALDAGRRRHYARKRAVSPRAACTPLITPRRTRLLRTAGLQGFQEAIAALTRTRDPWRARNTVVLVPTRAAAVRLRRTLEELTLLREPCAPVLVLPEVLSRADWYAALAERLVPPPALLSTIERYVCMLAAAREASAGGAEPPFQLRPGLVPAIVSFHDELLRQEGTVDSFERLVMADLEPSAGLDRGARRLLRQTRFLAATFRAFQQRAARTGRLDEHGLRRRAVDEGLARPLVHVVAAVADHAADPDGLWPADFDLLARLPALERIDVVATEAVLAAGFHERVTGLLPGIDEQRFESAPEQAPVLVAPADADAPHFVWRDREEELLGAVRRLKSPSRRSGDVRPGGGAVDGAEAVVFQRPLPYLYLARQSFAQAGVPFETHDSLPLAAEPYAAALDLVVEFVTSDYGRSATVELLRSPHFAFEDGGRALGAGAVDALDRVLHEVRYAGGRTALDRLAAAWAGAAGAGDPGPDRGHAAAARVAARLAGELRLLEEPAPPAAQLAVVASFLRRHRASAAAPPAARERESRARAAIASGLAALERAYRAIDDTPTAFPELMQSVRRWIETQTFTPAAGTGGVQLLDARVAPYGRFRELFLVGLVDGEWPARPARSVFYPAAVLAGLGWWAERDRFRAARARFTDLVRLARERVTLSAFALEDDAVVAPSVLLEQLAGLELATEREPAPRQPCVTPEEALLHAAVVPADLPAPAGPWIAQRRRRPARDDRFRGRAGASRAATHAVSALERYLACPFRYFARHELDLEEEAIDEPVLAPRQRGRFLHRVLESFYAGWQAAGRGAVTPANLDQALDRFGALVEAALGDLPPVDRAVARAWLTGSAAAPGLAEQLFQLEISQPADIVERLVEVRLERTYPVDDQGFRRTVRVRGTADRIDLLADGTFRIVDYKTDRAPRRDRALQLPVYARCAERRLDGHRQRAWRPGDAAYVAFGEPRLHVPLARGDLDRALSEGEARAVGALAQIGRGAYPARPAERQLCSHCPYPTVCRKDYVDE